MYNLHELEPNSNYIKPCKLSTSYLMDLRVRYIQLLQVIGTNEFLDFRIKELVWLDTASQ